MTAAAVFTVAAIPAWADLPTTTETSPTGTTTAPTTTADPAQTATTTPPPFPTTTTTTSAAATTEPTASGSTASTGAPAQGTPAATTAMSPLGTGCPVEAVVLLVPNRVPMSIGPTASGSIEVAAASRLAYPADGSIVSTSSVELGASACTAPSRKNAHAHVESVSIFRGLLTADRLDVTVGGSATTTIAALEIRGRSYAAPPGTRIPINGWGYAVTGARQPIRAAGGASAISALAVHLTEPHMDLPAGTVLLVSVATLPARAHQAFGKAATSGKRKRRTAGASRPLKVTPRLAFAHYVFPVAGSSEYVDTYGAFRSDVPGQWHHGDDIFAPLGTPVVAVATGTINRVGWERIGGWRLWVRDRAGDEFYYAHLSGYVPDDLHSAHVDAGQVIGFVGNTGDAVTSSPHLHFEIHPRPLLHLGYDGAVDPTRYLDGWTHLDHVRAPRPAHPSIPTQPPLRREVRYVWRELLAARHLIPHPPAPASRPKIHIPADANGPVRRPMPNVAVQAMSATESSPAGRARTSRSLIITALVALATLGLLVLSQLLPAPGGRTSA